MTDPDPHPDSPPDAPEDRESDIEQAVNSRTHDVERLGGGADTSPLQPTGVEDGVGGTGGVTKNQDDDAQ